MTQTPQLGLADSSDPDADEPARMSARSVVTVLAVLGVGCFAAALWWTRGQPPHPDTLTPDTWWPYLLLGLAIMVGEIVYYPVRHGDSYEEQTFSEIVLMVAVLLFAPSVALVGALLGLLFAELVLVRSVIKAVFNLSSNAIATSVLVVTYTVLDGPADRLSTRSVLALLVAALAWEFINLLCLSWILHAVEGVGFRELWRSQLLLTVLMAVASVGVAMTAVAMYPISPILALFALLPAVALWYAYKVTGARLEAQVRTQSIAEFSRVLTSTRSADRLLPMAAERLRRIFGADEVLAAVDREAVMSNRSHRTARYTITSREQELLDSVPTGSDEVLDIPKDRLPQGWTSGYNVPLDVGDGHAGMVALGAYGPPRGLDRILPWAKGGRELWRLRADDRPTLGSLAGSLASALRAARSLAALRDETAKLTAVVDHATDGIAGFDGSGRVMLWSPALAAMTGVTAPVETAATEPAAEQIVAALADLRPGVTPESQMITITRTDGEVRELDVAVVRIPDPDLYVLTVRDITRQRRVERMKSDFIATVSHELRTPITPIKGYAQLLAGRWDRMTPEKRTSVLGTIEDRANHLSRLVDDLLLASRVGDAENARLDVETSPADLAELVEESVAAFPALAARIEVTGRTVAIQCDRQRAVQCLSNLIGNAGKYSDPESPIRLEYGPLEGEPWGVVDVIDCGRGIPAEELDKVFDRFYRVEDPMTMTTGGSGLGLFISRELARAMQGDITVESVLGQGSRFQLRLPLLEENA